MTLNIEWINARKAIEGLYEHLCDISSVEKVRDSETLETMIEMNVTETGIPCRLSFDSKPEAKQGDVTEVTQRVTLFLAPEVHVPEGSRIKVTTPERDFYFKSSGAPGVYRTHQEISLEQVKRWA
jgi:hypothetical protein